MKTIAELNSKWWYRAIKVIYIAFVILCYATALGSIAGAYSTIKENKEEYANTLSENTEKIKLIEELKSNGSTTIQINDAIKRKYNQYGMVQLTREQYKAIYGEEEYKKIDDGKEHSLKPETPGTMKWLLLIIPGSILIAWFIPQLIKWIFYFIVLGTIKPPKK